MLQSSSSSSMQSKQQWQLWVPLAGCHAWVNESCALMTIYVLCRCLPMITSLVQVQRMLYLAPPVLKGCWTSFLWPCWITHSFWLVCFLFSICLLIYCFTNQTLSRLLESDNLKNSEQKGLFGDLHLSLNLNIVDLMLFVESQNSYLSAIR